MRNYLPCMILFILGVLTGCVNNDVNKATVNGSRNDTVNVTISETVSEPDPIDSIISSENVVLKADSNTEKIVRDYLLTRYRDDLEKKIIDSNSRKFIFHVYDLNEDSINEIFVGLPQSYFCGTGGCTILLLNNSGKLITRFTVTDFPVVVTNVSTKGWKDLLLASKGYYHRAVFDGKSYPGNPSILPLVNESNATAGKRLLDYTKEPFPWFRF